MAITNPQAATHSFLSGLYADGYYPDAVVDKGAAILVRLCERIEAERPGDLSALYVLTAAATEEFNALEAEFDAAGSEIETVARGDRRGLLVRGEGLRLYRRGYRGVDRAARVVSRGVGQRVVLPLAWCVRSSWFPGAALRFAPGPRTGWPFLRRALLFSSSLRSSSTRAPHRV